MFITLLVVIGVRLALAEFRQEHTALRPEDKDDRHVGTPEAG
jgi:hypothetical protein